MTDRYPARPRGFTLIELLAVVTCIVLLAALVMYAVSGAQERARIAVCASNLRNIGLAATNYATENSTWYPLHGAKDKNKFTADVSSFLGGTGYWFGNERYQGTNDDQRTAENATGRLPYTGIGQALLNGGSYAGAAYVTNGNYLSGKVYLNNAKVFYCPNQLEGTFWTANMDQKTYTLVNGSGTTVKTIKDNNQLIYFSLPVNQRRTSEMPEIGYSATNGNSPGYPETTDTGNITDYKMWRYQGKYVYYTSGSQAGQIFNGKDLSSWKNERFAAGFLTDPPNTILLADISLISNAGNGDPTVKVQIGRRGRTDFLEVSHEDGLNTLYNDNHVGYMKFGSDRVSKSTIYYGNDKGATIFGPR